ncbi:MAG: hypothetical protein WKF78_00480 [Candidatus Limnocylindrales bacterium]
MSASTFDMRQNLSVGSSALDNIIPPPFDGAARGVRGTRFAAVEFVERLVSTPWILLMFAVRTVGVRLTVVPYRPSLKRTFRSAPSDQTCHPAIRPASKLARNGLRSPAFSFLRSVEHSKAPRPSVEREAYEGVELMLGHADFDELFDADHEPLRILPQKARPGPRDALFELGRLCSIALSMVDEVSEADRRLAGSL